MAPNSFQLVADFPSRTFDVLCVCAFVQFLSCSDVASCVVLLQFCLVVHQVFALRIHKTTSQNRIRIAGRICGGLSFGLARRLRGSVRWAARSMDNPGTCLKLRQYVRRLLGFPNLCLLELLPLSLHVLRNLFTSICLRCLLCIVGCLMLS